MRVITKGTAEYPNALAVRLGDVAPPQGTVEGETTLLGTRKLAFLALAKTPGSAIVAAHDLSAELRDFGTRVISGFHSLLEEDCLQILLRE